MNKKNNKKPKKKKKNEATNGSDKHKAKKLALFDQTLSFSHSHSLSIFSSVRSLSPP